MGVKFGWCYGSVRGELGKDVYVGYRCASCLVCLCSVVGAGDWVPFHKIGSGTRRSGSVSCVLLEALGHDVGYWCVLHGCGVGL